MKISDSCHTHTHRFRYNPFAHYQRYTHSSVLGQRDRQTVGRTLILFEWNVKKRQRKHENLLKWRQSTDWGDRSSDRVLQQNQTHQHQEYTTDKKGISFLPSLNSNKMYMRPSQKKQFGLSTKDERVERKANKNVGKINDIKSGVVSQNFI